MEVGGQQRLTFRVLLNITLRKCFNFIAWSGVLLILFGVFNTFSNKLAQLEHYANWVSAALTLGGACLTASSIYLPQNPKPPEYFSKWVSAPITILTSIFCIGYLILYGNIDPHIVNGFALLAIAGGLFRIQGNPSIR